MSLIYLGDTKRCSKCKKYRPFSEFFKCKPGRGCRPPGEDFYIKPECKTCHTGPHKFRSRENRFWVFYRSHTRREGDCLIWTGRYTGDVEHGGRPAYKWDNKQLSVRRIVYRLSVGSLEDDCFVHMKCGSVACVRADHMKKATKEEQRVLLDNSAPTGDRHGTHTHPERLVCGDRHWTHKHPERIKRGEQKPESKLTDADIRIIRARSQSGEATRVLAREFGVHQKTMMQIVRGKSWKHIQ